jgi:hypothetical protein
LERGELEAAGRLLASVDWPRAATARRRRDEQVDHGPRHPVKLRDRQGVLPAHIARRLMTSADNDRRGPLEGSDPIGPYRSSWTPRADLLRLLSTLGALYFTEGRGEDGSIYFTLYRAGGVAWEREIGWSDYRAVEDHLLEAHEGQIEATCNTSREGYANRERYEISGPLVELFERRTADGRWLPVREARQVDAELADAARRAGERHPRTRLGPGATYRVRFPHWYRDDLETNGRRTFVALDTLRFLRGSHVRLYCFLQSLEAKRYSKGPLQGGRYKTFYSPGSERDPLLFSLGIFDPDRARVIEHLEDALSYTDFV